MSFKIEYGMWKSKIDVTQLCMDRLCRNGVITIPALDHLRADIFTDVAPGKHKSVFISLSGEQKLTEYNHRYTVLMYTDTKKVKAYAIEDPVIHRKYTHLAKDIAMVHGNLDMEIPEMKMATRYITGNEKVLELGGNVGRNSLIIAKILGDNAHNLVTLESDKNIANQLIANRDANNMTFHVEPSALSKTPLVQHGWDTRPYDGHNVPEGWLPVNTISVYGLIAKYSIVFDTLVADCEGALYHILKDTPHILDSIKLVIMENDYTEISEKNFVDNMLIENGFRVDYVEAGGFGPCFHNFFEVWKKDV